MGYIAANSLKQAIKKARERSGKHGNKRYDISSIKYLGKNETGTVRDGTAKVYKVHATW